MKVYNFPEGEVYEGGCHWKSTGFEIRVNEEVGHACRHCHSEKKEIGPTSYDPKKTYEWRSYICPAVTNTVFFYWFWGYEKDGVLVGMLQQKILSE